MNTSFSKRRHISEVNQILEERFLLEQNTDKTPNTPGSGVVSANGKTFQVTPGTEKYNLGRIIWSNNFMCVTGKVNLKNIGPDNSIYLNGVYYYPNGRYVFPGSGSGKYQCNDGDIFLYPVDSKTKITQQTIQGQETKNIQTPPNTTDKKTQSPKWVTCSDNFKLFCYNKTEITRLQGCLGVKKDGYFGGNTQKALNGKFPQFKGVVKKTDIDSICNTTPKGSAYQAEDNIDPTQQVNTPVTNVQSLQPKQQQTVTANTRNMQNPQLSQQTIQQAGKDYQKNFNDYKNKYPGLSTNEINRLLGVNPK